MGDALQPAVVVQVGWAPQNLLRPLLSYGHGARDGEARRRADEASLEAAGYSVDANELDASDGDPSLPAKHAAASHPLGSSTEEAGRFFVSFASAEPER
jgi:hypothetical protein